MAHIDEGEGSINKLIVDVKCRERALTIKLTDGRLITVPSACYPRLLKATKQGRKNWQLIGRGIGIHWPDIDEDISVESLLRGAAAPRKSAG